jgi:hypothetical protein
MKHATAEERQMIADQAREVQAGLASETALEKERVQAYEELLRTLKK